MPQPRNWRCGRNVGKRRSTEIQRPKTGRGGLPTIAGMKHPSHRARAHQGTHPLFGRRPPLAFVIGLALDPRLARGGGSEGVGTRGVSLKRSSTLASGGSNTGQVGGRLKIETQGYAAKRRETVPSVGTPLGPRSFLAVFRTQRTASKFLKTLARPKRFELLPPRCRATCH
jgi:hypothetical protein